MIKIQTTYFQAIQKPNEKELLSRSETWEENYFLDKLGEREKTENHKKPSKYLSSSKIIIMNLNILKINPYKQILNMLPKLSAISRPVYDR